MTKYSIHHSVVSLFRTLIRDDNPEADFTVIPASARESRVKYDNVIVIARGPSSQAEAILSGVEKVNFAVIPTSERESSVSTITLPCRLRLLMQTNLFNCPVMQTVVSTLIHWILDQVEDDIQYLSSLRGGPSRPGRSNLIGGGESKLRCHSCARGNPVGVVEKIN